MLELEIRPESGRPPRQVRLVWRGRAPHLGARVLVSVFLAPFFLVPLVLLGGRADAGAPPAAWEQAVALLMVAVWYALLLGFVWLLGAVAGAWTDVCFDAERRAFTARFTGRLLWARRGVHVRFPDLERVDLEIPGERGGAALPLVCRVGWRDAAGRGESLTLDLPVRDLDRRGEAMALGFEIARVLGWSAYRVERSDHLCVHVRLLRDARGLPDALSVPAAGDALELTRAGGSVPVPEPRLPAFDPASLPGPFRVTEWRPGTRVRLLAPGASRRSVGATAAVLAVVLCVPAAALAVFGEVLPFGHLLWIPAVQAPVLGGLIGWLVLRRARREREVLLDWRRGVLRLRDGSDERTHPLREVREVRARLCAASERRTVGEDTTTVTVHWGEVAAVVDGREVLLLETGRGGADPDRLYSGVAPLADELARALGVPWQWEA